MSAVKYLFVDSAAMTEGPTLRRAVLPALWKLQRGGYRIVWLGPAAEPLRELVATQEVSFQSDEIPESDALASLGHFVSRYVEMDRARSLAAGNGMARTAAELLGIESLTEFGWNELAARLLGAPRRGIAERKTAETAIRAEVFLDDAPRTRIATGIGFLDHMLEQVAKHGGFGLGLEVQGDLHVDEHHTVEDAALTLGLAFRRALGDRVGIGRYGFTLPMDEAQARVAIDLSGRPYAVFKGDLKRERVGELATELVPHFFRSLAESLGAAIHVEVVGENTHHMVEAAFKGLGRALRQAVQRTDEAGVPSTKGVL